MTDTLGTTASAAAHTEGLRIGTAPDSWGVWFADHPRQTPWDRFLDEVAEAGYHYIELGPTATCRPTPNACATSSPSATSSCPAAPSSPASTRAPTSGTAPGSR